VKLIFMDFMGGGSLHPKIIELFSHFTLIVQVKVKKKYYTSEKEMQRHNKKYE